MEIHKTVFTPEGREENKSGQSKVSSSNPLKDTNRIIPRFFHRINHKIFARKMHGLKLLHESKESADALPTLFKGFSKSYFSGITASLFLHD